MSDFHSHFILLKSNNYSNQLLYHYQQQHRSNTISNHTHCHQYQPSHSLCTTNNIIHTIQSNNQQHHYNTTYSTSFTYLHSIPLFQPLYPNNQYPSQDDTTYHCLHSFHLYLPHSLYNTLVKDLIKRQLSQ